MTEMIVALDVDTIQEAREMVRGLRSAVTLFKIGMRLFVAHGKRAVDLVHQEGGRVFLDLKLHDIPQTVSHAVKHARELGAWSVSLHLMGGAAMIRAAAEVRPRPKLWGVTVLTSLSSEDLRFIHPEASAGAMAESLAKIARAQRLDGVICSAHEVPALQKLLPEDACFITPGIRPSGSASDDQRRVVTPAEAARLGIRYIVVGRPVTRAPNPQQAAIAILREMQRAVRSSIEAAP